MLVLIIGEKGTHRDKTLFSQYPREKYVRKWHEYSLLPHVFASLAKTSKDSTQATMFFMFKCNFTKLFKNENIF